MKNPYQNTDSFSEIHDAFTNLLGVSNKCEVYKNMITEDYKRSRIQTSVYVSFSQYFDEMKNDIDVAIETIKKHASAVSRKAGTINELC
ncbi:hypothetical protein [Bacillus atrophaeus]|uniref:hypothetical protein n=1 Tax=Bacillus atrophaeus TaxID=1452 RepID=UPI002280B797|nr:hypothetical protein [Bacillus atrophaeus]MCY8497606.1 hypothetical protein [Bacillus atrophaeus]MCY8814308.1 hypothetical protein [Bacillus atrophaeus]MCY8816164.1 hypothetical protein [Bacillus atrophaeus]MCY8823095.1 hypothetical protein [Bacillus atrophaeus]MCY8828689.1 hypothetical protein [Bacillus atrophaeus]